MEAPPIESKPIDAARDGFWMRIIAILSIVVSGAVAFLIFSDFSCDENDQKHACPAGPFACFSVCVVFGVAIFDIL